MKKTIFFLGLLITYLGFSQVADTGDKVGIGNTNPQAKLHVNGNLGIGLMNGSSSEGFSIDYVDGGSGTTIFKNNRWGGNIYFKRNSSLGERIQFLFGGAGNHYMNIYDDNNQTKVRFISSGNSYINGGNLGIGTVSPSQKLDVEGLVASKGIVLIDPDLGSNSDYTALFREDNGVDNAVVKLRIGDDQLGSLNIGYKYWSTGEWVSTFFVNNYGQVGIGTTNTQGFKLGVDGDIAATEVKIATYSNWSDFVFSKDYELPALKEVEQHIKEKGHLKNIPNAKEVKKDGFYLAEMNAKLLQKIEELTLYAIEQEKKLEAQSVMLEKLYSLREENKQLHKKFEALEALVTQMIKNTKN